ncbi:dUTP diphosphatase [Halobacillus sp. A5]|uniref:dUTP diphosphatase n=1 Tax=Halobacillus sp. A5 TaxID=2880263 RepID=UPI0020A67B7A|nr:dUTP diphosphatase [Halobacillus sp. A5]MCP3025484.1 dUTP diphosphatase [Halobacillus sp. A5]
MDWTTYYNWQAQLDEHIIKTQSLEEAEVIDDKILALYVEVGELANETRCFKFWSTKPSSDKKVVLEEYVDGLHFILSLGLDLDFRYESGFLTDISNKTDAFLNVFTSIEQFKHERNKSSYEQMFEAYLILGQSLGIAESELKKAYEYKNQINFQRQNQGY